MEKKEFINFVITLGKTVQSVGSVPSGHLYAMICGEIDLNTYNAALTLLIDQKVITRDPSHLLTFIG